MGETAQSIQGFYKSIVLKLNALYPLEECGAITDRLFEHFWDLTPVQRILMGKMKADSAKISLIEAASVKLLNHIPLQYITGKAFFMDLELAVKSSVLIPRPETEELVSHILQAVSSKNTSRKLNILDIGTGSGCISIALQQGLPEAEITAIDISSEAIAVASANASMYKAKIDFRKLDIFDETHWNQWRQFDLIVSNPPYVTVSEKVMIKPNVLDNEPHGALFVPDNDPLLFYRKIMAFAKTNLSKSGELWFEINENFGIEMKDLAYSQGFREVNIIFDFRGKSRFLHCFNK